MPRLRASRGDVKRTSSPSTSSSPSSCCWRPEMILMRVDLPAPLSPRTHVISPALTRSEMPESALMLPYRLPTSFISTRGFVAVAGFVSTVTDSSPPRRQLPDVSVEHRRQQQHDSQEELEPVGVPTRVDDAFGRHSEDQSPHRGPDRRAEAAGEETASDDCRDYVEELVSDALAGLDGVEREQDVHAHKPRHHTDHHEEADLRLVHWHTHGARAVCVAANRKDPVADARLEQHHGADGDEEQPPEDGDAHRDGSDRDRGREDRRSGRE